MLRELKNREYSKGSICLSVVSHDQDDFVDQLLTSIDKYCRSEHLSVIVTRNTKNPSKYMFERFSFPVTVLQNITPKGFGANHNQAFATCRQEYFCVLNPDIIFRYNPFTSLISCFCKQDVGVVAPELIDSNGVLQDSFRQYPTPGRILNRIVKSKRKEIKYSRNNSPVFPDWVAGMFMVFPADIYSEMSGFDERFFMYCEDADICMRLFQRGYKTQLVSQVQAIHNARRASHRTIQHLYWHLSSLLRFFLKFPFYRL